MKRIEYEKPNNLPKLHDELIAAGVIPLRVEGLGASFYLTLEDDQDEDSIQAVIDAHNPAPLPKPVDPGKRREAQLLLLHAKKDIALKDSKKQIAGLLLTLAKNKIS